ncbi:hypothetical protein OGAPHI_003574 [Ogataea philodendri]|uniref:Uncharacterized protein n=1 Tax=Ogataea philodendri TaxID=1378263 RepID=A0A9P8T4T2_9ASCO|nr:uncharacterized protein OGAPHI_003574 [Ogataea philodendri]KAH3665390.1 hypothetical protein OGAPHI_003574 [Ogataea philodendri]
MAPFFKNKNKHSKTSSDGSNLANSPSSSPQASRSSSGQSTKLFNSAYSRSPGIGLPPNKSTFKVHHVSGERSVSVDYPLNSAPSALSLSQYGGASGTAQTHNLQYKSQIKSETENLPHTSLRKATDRPLQSNAEGNNTREFQPGKKNMQDFHSNLNVSSSSPWKKKTLYNSPFPRFSHAASSTTSEAGAVYLMGGLCGKNVFGDMWIVEPVKSENDRSKDYPYIASPIENFERIPTPRIGHSSILIGNAFIVFAGDTVTNATQELDDKLYFFNITSLKWTITSPEGPKPSGRYGHQIGVLNFENSSSQSKWSSFLYVFGGQVENEYFSDMWKFDLSNFRNPKTCWEKIIPEPESYIPPQLSNHTMTAYDDKFYVFGGTDGVKVYNFLLCFDALTNQWNKCILSGFLPPPLESHSATLHQNLLFIFGGKLLNGETSSDMFIINLDSFECFQLQSNLPNCPSPRCGHTITVDSAQEKMLVMGGDQLDSDFQGISESQNKLIQTSQFEYPSSVIYELDLLSVPKFLRMHDALASENGVPGSTSVDKITHVSQTQDEHSPDKNVSKILNRQSQYVVYENASDDEVVHDVFAPQDTSSRVWEDVENPNSESHTHVALDVSKSDNNSRIQKQQKNELTLKTEDCSSVKSTGSDSSPVNRLLEPLELSAPNKEAETIRTSTDVNDEERHLTGNKFPQMKRSSELSLDARHPDVQTRPVTASWATSAPVSGPNVGKNTTEEFHQLLKKLREEMGENMDKANQKLNNLEKEKQILLTENRDLKSKLCGCVDDTQTRELKCADHLDTSNQPSVRNISSGRIFELENQLTLLKAENASLSSTLEEFKPAFNNHVKNMSGFESVIKSQKESISFLRASLKGEAAILKKIYDLEAHIKYLESQAKTLGYACGALIPHTDGDNEDETQKVILERTDTHRQIVEASNNLSSFVNVINKVPQEKLFAELVGYNTTGGKSSNEGKDQLISDLQLQIEKLIECKKSDDNKIGQLEARISELELRTKELEDMNHASHTSLKNSHKALTISQNEIEKLKDSNKQLTSSLKEYELGGVDFKNTKADDSSSMGTSAQKDIAGNAQWYFKLKDLEAELFIVNQERDHLKEETIALKKKLFKSSS